MMSDTPSVSRRLAGCFRLGATQGLRTALWLMKFIIPISFGVALLKWSGVLTWLARWIEPLFRLIGLPGESAIAFLTAMLLNVYSGIAAMAAIGLTDRQLTILGVMMLIAHNLPIECVVQGKAGSPGVRLMWLRIVAAFAAAFLMNLVLPAAEVVPTAVAPAVAEGQTPGNLLADWAVETGWLTLKIGLFVTGVMVLQRMLDEFGAMTLLTKWLAWPLAALGLPRRTIFLWIVANTLGLAYGAAVIVEEAKLGELSEEEVNSLNVSIAICHSLLEDTILVASIGAWAVWLVAPRVALAAAAVWAYRAWRRVRVSSAPGH